MPNVKHIIPINNHSISERTISTWSKSSIQSTQNEFKSIKFDNNQGVQVDKPIGDENTTTYIEDVPVDIDNNYYPFGHDINYA